MLLAARWLLMMKLTRALCMLLAHALSGCSLHGGYSCMLLAHAPLRQ
jgi:hypothetical protein